VNTFDATAPGRAVRRTTPPPPPKNRARTHARWQRAASTSHPTSHSCRVCAPPDSAASRRGGRRGSAGSARGVNRAQARHGGSTRPREMLTRVAPLATRHRQSWCSASRPSTTASTRPSPPPPAAMQARARPRAAGPRRAASVGATSLPVHLLTASPAAGISDSLRVGLARMDSKVRRRRPPTRRVAAQARARARRAARAEPRGGAALSGPGSLQ